MDEKGNKVIKNAKRTKGRQSNRWMRKVTDEVIKNAKRTKGRQSGNKE